MNDLKGKLLLVMGLLSVGMWVTGQYLQDTYGQILEKDALPAIPLTGNMTSLEDIDISIDPLDEPLPVNGTLTIQTAGATDLDITEMPPAGMTIIIDNSTATVTNHPVTVGE